MMVTSQLRIYFITHFTNMQMILCSILGGIVLTLGCGTTKLLVTLSSFLIVGSLLHSYMIKGMNQFRKSDKGYDYGLTC